METATILYVHGMGGGADSRIPWLLGNFYKENGIPVNIVCRTYDFRPQIALAQVRAWYEEIHPDLVVGESLGSCYVRLLPADVRRLYVSPAFNGPATLGRLSFITLIPGMPALLKRIYRTRKGERQLLDFHFNIVRRFNSLRRQMLSEGSDGPEPFAFFGVRDHYRRAGVVTLGSWVEMHGDSCHVEYDGTHFMEEEFVKGLLAPKIVELTLSRRP